ncbi:arginase family protein [Nodosilinea sp. AN01ver1]|uniref:arginase family protein n=1 Tax=Nodosilinea sp. AN01ver1 TaxID=3423362 RepID=UPI003D30F6E3
MLWPLLLVSMLDELLMPASSTRTLNLFFPQWQGSARLELYEGAKLLHKTLHNKISFEQVPISLTYSLTIEKNIFGYSQIFSQLLDARKVIQAHNPERILTIGGDCGVEIALHKMPLRVLLGEGDAEIVKRAFSTLRPEQVFLIGAREFDLAEKSVILEKGLSVFSAKDINLESFGKVFSALNEAGSDKIYIHLDLDVIDPEEWPHVACPTPGGIYVDKLKSFLNSLRKNFDVVGFSVLEFLPTGSNHSAALEIAPMLEGIELIL